MRINEILQERSGALAPLYHSIRQLEHAYQALRDNRLLATSTQRFWPDGKRRKEDDPQYEGSYWMKGISLTRSQSFAFRWGGTILVLDQQRLRQKYKIIPFNWNYHMKDDPYFPFKLKKEFEEYLVIKATPDNYINPPEYEGEPEKDRFDINRFTSPEGYIPNLNQYIKGIYLDKITYEVYTDHGKKNNDKIKYIMDNPKFLGISD